MRLRPQQLQLLTVLLRHAGRLVARDELKQALWSEQTFVEFEDSLNHAVIRLRKALGDSAEEPRFIETVPKRGYRFIAAVESREASHPAARPAGTPRHARWVLLALAGVALVGTAVAVFRLESRRRERIESLAVLQLLNLTGDPGQDFFSDGVTEDLTTQLARIDRLRVISRTSAMRYKGTRKPLAEIGRELSVDAVVEGAVQRSGERVRITLQLVRASTDRHLWATTYEGPMAEVLALEARATRDIARQVELRLSAEDEARLGRAHRVDPEAYEAYLKGRRAARLWDRPHLLEAIEHFEEAVRRDPDYALAYAQLAHAYDMVQFIRGLAPNENTLKGRGFTSKALELDDGLAEAHVDLGDIRFYGDWEWSAGEAEFRHAVELDQGSVDALEHYLLCLRALRRYDEAAQQARRALRLDPMAPRLNAEMGDVLRDAGDSAGAVRQYLKALDLEPGYASAFARLGSAYEDLGRDQEAVAAHQRAESLAGEDPAVIAQLSEAFQRAGMHGYWAARLARLQAQAAREAVSPLELASIYVRLGQLDAALDWLDRAHGQHVPMLVWVYGGRDWAPLRNHPRYQALLKLMRLPPA
ncbi:MAG TPA: tetratricopeptide repeat protein [Vicinamibacteria bacterium]|nr:tetratricopeptide repeat protein [Vicinamibacteria bacterium]